MIGIAERDLDEVVTRTEDVWRSLRGARLFMTGASGFYGAWLVATFAHAKKRLGIDIPLTILTRSPDDARARLPGLFEAAGAELVAGDVRSFALAGAFSHVVHGATSASAALNFGNPFEMFDVIVDGTKRCLEVARAAGATRFLLTSSGAVYGPQSAGMTHVAEDHRGGPDPLDVGNAYAEGKRAAEHLCAIFALSAKMELVVTRGFAFVGAYLPLDTHFAVGNFLRDALAGGPIRILGDGTPYRSYMYGTDLATWTWTMLARGTGAYNLGSDDGRPLGEIAGRVAALAGVTVEIAKKPVPGAIASRYVPATARAKELGLSLEVPLDEAISRTIAFHSSKKSE